MWASMTPAQREQTLHNMAEFGGSFVATLAYAWRMADARNSQILGEAFNDLVVRYGSMGPAQ